MRPLYLPVRNPARLASPEVLNQSWSIDFMHDALVCGRRFRTFNVVDDFNGEALAIEIDLNILSTPRLLTVFRHFHCPLLVINAVRFPPFHHH